MRPSLRRLLVCSSFALWPLALTQAAESAPATAATDAERTIRAIYTEALTHGQAYDDLRALVTDHPGRLAGSKALEGAISWTQQAFGTLHADRVYLQDVMVPHWERGAPESVFIAGANGAQPLTAVALGGSGATPADGLVADVIEVRSLDELAQLGQSQIAGKIVFFNRPMDPSTIRAGSAYGAAGDQRNRGPAAAAKLGAAGAIVRSLTHRLDDIPHTGATTFPPDAPKIPAAALSTLAADRLSAAITDARKQDAVLRVGLKINARWFPDAPSHNVIAEIRGSELPDEILVVGGHIDSWDIAPGAHDDGAGIVQSMEVIRIFRALGLKPRHTLRCVAFVNEENGTAGAKAYAVAAANAKEKHLFALESDNGGFQPHAVAIVNTSGTAAARAERWLPLLRPYGIYELRKSGAGTDVSPLIAQGAVAGETSSDSQRYFDIHHTAEDSLDKVNPRELEIGAATMAALIWLADTQGI